MQRDHPQHKSSLSVSRETSVSTRDSSCYFMKSKRTSRASNIGDLSAPLHQRSSDLLSTTSSNLRSGKFKRTEEPLNNKAWNENWIEEINRRKNLVDPFTAADKIKLTILRKNILPGLSSSITPITTRSPTNLTESENNNIKILSALEKFKKTKPNKLKLYNSKSSKDLMQSKEKQFQKKLIELAPSACDMAQPDYDSEFLATEPTYKTESRYKRISPFINLVQFRGLHLQC